MTNPPVSAAIGQIDTEKGGFDSYVSPRHLNTIPVAPGQTMQHKTQAGPQSQSNSLSTLYHFLGLLAVLAVVILVLTAVNTDSIGKLKTAAEVHDDHGHDEAMAASHYDKPPVGTNVCAGKKPKSGFDNFACAEAAVNEQAAADVSSPFIGTKTTTAEPVLTSYWQAGLCPVNVHWHLGAEHRSAGQFDETGTGPADPHDWDGKGRMGLRCKHYNDYQDLFTKEYAWEHCKHMQVGETYEVHWPHSAAGACGTINQYQTPFYDGVFCTDGAIDISTNKQIGVQSQTFTIVNDEAYYYPDLIKGMIVDGQFGDDMVFYTGSTTGDGRSNSICSAYAPITWQVDRKCHMISASSFDKMCADMKAQRDDMSDDLHPHGAREVVSAALTANNMKAGSMSGGRATIDP